MKRTPAFEFMPGLGPAKESSFHQLETMLAVWPLKAFEAINGFSFPF
jgi:hypothetical protein